MQNEGRHTARFAARKPRSQWNHDDSKQLLGSDVRVVAQVRSIVLR